MDDVAPADYTWDMAAKDLALMTPLAITETRDWISLVRQTKLTAYEALPFLIKVVKALPDHRVGPEFFRNMGFIILGDPMCVCGTELSTHGYDHSFVDAAEYYSRSSDDEDARG